MNEKQFEFLLYQSAEEDISVNALIKDDTIWLTQKAMAELFDCSADNISLHLKNIFADGELDKDSVTEKISATASDGKNYRTQFYNLDAIISVGYRVNSRRATNFRIWATGILKEYMIKGFALDDMRLKQGKDAFGKDYFRELLERVRSIRASERRIWQQITDIFAECSIDYDKNAQITHEFYAMVQIDTPHGESRGILGSTTTACPCEVLHGVPERIGLGVSRPTIYADYANRRSPSLRMFVAAFMSLSWCSPHSGQTHSRTARSFVPVH